MATTMMTTSPFGDPPPLMPSGHDSWVPVGEVYHTWLAIDYEMLRDYLREEAKSLVLRLALLTDGKDDVIAIWQRELS